MKDPTSSLAACAPGCARRISTTREHIVTVVKYRTSSSNGVLDGRECRLEAENEGFDSASAVAAGFLDPAQSPVDDLRKLCRMGCREKDFARLSCPCPPPSLVIPRYPIAEWGSRI
jgi:hypothetical protein